VIGRKEGRKEERKKHRGPKKKKKSRWIICISFVLTFEQVFESCQSWWCEEDSLLRCQ
jgi:hypothetical protein